MSLTLATFPLASSQDAVAARQQVRRIAELLGLERTLQTRIATAVSEIARNAVGHAGGGELTVRVGDGALQVDVRDQGPGIDDVDAVLEGRRAYLPGRGSGIASARRLVDRFEIRSSPHGTEVRLACSLPHGTPTAARLAQIRAAQPVPAPDPIAVLQEQDRELIENLADLQQREAEAQRLSRELDDTNRGVVALYSELEQKADELRSASEMKSRFLSHMSHEFRTPLNSIMALSRLLIDGIDGELGAEQLRQVEYIRKSAQTLLELVNDLLDLAKVEAGKLDVRPGPVLVENLFASLRGALRPLLTNAAVSLEFDAPPDFPELLADEQKLAQVLRNLIANALRFTEAGYVRVSARHDAAGGQAVFVVEDSGVGIPADSLETIFEEFSQVPGRLQRGGTGLGLPLSRRLATLLGGAITVASEAGIGSTFELSIPLRFGQALPAASLARRRLLVVDDEEAFRYVIRHIAQDAQFTVLEAENGDAGMAIAEAERPDLIVLDLHMPKVDGFAMIALLSEHPQLQRTPVVVCSSHALSVDQKRALAPAYAIVPKHDVARDSLRRLLLAAVESVPRG